MFKSKITTAAAFTALSIAVLGATPAGHAAGRLAPGNGATETPSLTKAYAVSHGACCQKVPIG